jgi:superfamily II DNA or RNA helicase
MVQAHTEDNIVKVVDSKHRVQSLNIKKSLRKCGAAKLSELVGSSRLEMIVSILGGRVTEGQMVDILLSKFGSQVLANKDIRGALLKTLSKDHLKFLLFGDSNNSTDLTTKNLMQLDKEPWKNNHAITDNWISLFGLTEEYLPPIREKVPSTDVLGVDTILYPYQKRVKDRLVRLLLSASKRVLLHMPTGAGKTRTTIEGLVDYWRSQGDATGFMIWLTDSEELCTQAEETFAKMWKVRGDRPIKLIRLWGRHKIKNLDDTGGLIIASLQKLHSLRTTPSDNDFKLISNIRSRSRLIVVDEAHKSIAPTYKATIEFLCDLEKTKLIGLTATPGRTNPDQIDELVEFYDNNKITLTDDNQNDIEDPIAFLQEHDYLSNITRRQVATDVTIDLTPAERASIGDFFGIPSRVLLALSKDEQRNAIIVKEIAGLCEEDHQVIVFACSVEHAHLISELLMIRGISCRCVDGGTPSHDRVEYIKEYKNGDVKVIVNYGVLTTGFDAPNTNAVVITRPTGSLVLYSQMIGRGIRGPKMGGTPDCVLVDLEDNLTGYPSERQAFKFFDNYWRN